MTIPERITAALIKGFVILLDFLLCTAASNSSAWLLTYVALESEYLYHLKIIIDTRYHLITFFSTDYG